MKDLLKNEVSEYFMSYINKVNATEPINALENQLKKAAGFFNDIEDSKSNFRYSEGKWSIKEVLGHCIDAERILVYRALCYARNDKTNLPQFDEDEYVANAEFDRIPFEDLKKELRFVRKSTIMFFKSLNEEELKRSGKSGESKFSVRGIAFIIVGHLQHHMEVIEERYL